MPGAAGHWSSEKRLSRRRSSAPGLSSQAYFLSVAGLNAKLVCAGPGKCASGEERRVLKLSSPFRVPGRSGGANALTPWESRWRAASPCVSVSPAASLKTGEVKLSGLCGCLVAVYGFSAEFWLSECIVCG